MIGLLGLLGLLVIGLALDASSAEDAPAKGGAAPPDGVAGGEEGEITLRGETGGDGVQDGAGTNAPFGDMGDGAIAGAGPNDGIAGESGDDPTGWFGGGDQPMDPATADASTANFWVDLFAGGEDVFDLGAGAAPDAGPSNGTEHPGTGAGPDTTSGDGKADASIAANHGGDQPEPGEAQIVSEAEADADEGAGPATIEGFDAARDRIVIYYDDPADGDADLQLLQTAPSTVDVFAFGVLVLEITGVSADDIDLGAGDIALVNTALG